jgi:hypothetical protein
MAACTQLLDYCATHPNPTIRYLASDMILALDTDGSYLSELNDKSRAAAYAYLIRKDNSDFHNGAIMVLSAIIKHMMASASETELAALFYGCKAAIPLQIALKEMGHPQPGPTPITTDNSTAIGLTQKNNEPKGNEVDGYEISLAALSTHTTAVRLLMGQRHKKTGQVTPANIIHHTTTWPSTHVMSTTPSTVIIEKGGEGFSFHYVTSPQCHSLELALARVCRSISHKGAWDLQTLLLYVQTRLGPALATYNARS